VEDSLRVPPSQRTDAVRLSLFPISPISLSLCLSLNGTRLGQDLDTVYTLLQEQPFVRGWRPWAVRELTRAVAYREAAAGDVLFRYAVHTHTHTHSPPLCFRERERDGGREREREMEEERGRWVERERWA
jgi:hypothetical protein